MDNDTYITNHRTTQWEELAAQLTAAYKEMEPTILALEEPAKKFAHGNHGVAHQFIDVVPNVLQHFTMMAEEYRTSDLRVLGNNLLRYAHASEALKQHVVTTPKLDETAKANLCHQLTLFEGRMAGIAQEMSLAEQAASPTVDEVAIAQSLTANGKGARPQR